MRKIQHKNMTAERLVAEGKKRKAILDALTLEEEALKISIKEVRSKKRRAKGMLDTCVHWMNARLGIIT